MDIRSALQEFFDDGGTQKEINEIVRGILSLQPTKKIAINACYGGFSLSSAAREALGEGADSLSRDDPRLISVIEEMGGKVSGSCSNLTINEVPIASDWNVDDYDGYESVDW